MPSGPAPLDSKMNLLREAGYWGLSPFALPTFCEFITVNIVNIVMADNSFTVYLALQGG